MKTKTMKKLLLLTACLTLLVLTVVGVTLTSSAEVTDDSGSCGENVTYTFDAETGTLTISGTGEMANYSSYSSVPWYSYRSSIKTVTIGDSVTSIGHNAFYNCDALTSIHIPDNVTRIGSSTFLGCRSLTSITVDANNPNYCSIEKNLYNKNATTLIQYAIGKADTFFTIPDSVTKIDSSAFFGCSNLTNITLPDSITSIGSSAFLGCSSLTSINIPDRVTSIGTATFRDCNSLTSITIPNSITSIGNSAFFGCNSLTSIHIPNSITNIDNSAFRDCGSLTSITVDANNPQYCSIDGILYNKNATTLIQYAIGKTGTSFTIPDNVTSIGNYAFEYCRSLTSITIPDSVTSIGWYAFSGCSSLTSITIPNSVTSIGNFTFSNCGSLTSITIPDSVTSIGNYAFVDCSSLTSITIPDSVTSIGNSAFNYCKALTSITIPDSVTSIGDKAFYYCSSLTSITIPDSVTSIGDSAFRYCYDLEKIIYCGTLTEWAAISKGSGWDSSAGRNTTNGTYTIQYHSYVDGVCEYCGAIQPVINNVNIAIGQDIIVNYYATVPSDYTNLTMKFTMGDKTATVSGVATGVANQYVFSFEGVSPQCMGDAITAQLYSGTGLIAEKGAYTVKAYLEYLIASNDYDEKTKTLAKDTLIYGGAAQIYKNYKTDALVSEGITGSSHTLPSASGIELSNGTGATFTNATVWFDNINKLRVKFTADSTENLIVKINGTQAEYVLGDDGKYHVHTRALYAIEFDEFFTFEIYINGSLVSSLKYSVNSYVYTMLSSTNEPMKNLAIALYNYGYSADIYHGTPQTPMVSEEEAAKADPTKGFQGEEHLFTPFG